MGMDIHMHILDGNTGLIKFENIYTGRNSDWFGNLIYGDNDWEYDYLPTSCGIAGSPDETIIKDYKEYDTYFNFRNMTVGDFIAWFNKYNPALKAGYFTEYEKFKLSKGWEPDPDNIPIYKRKSEDLTFIEYHISEPSEWLIDFILENGLEENDIILYYFDR